MYSSSFQIPADFMVCTAAASRYRQTSWYVQQQLPDTSRFHGMYRSFQIPADFMVCAYSSFQCTAASRYRQTSWYVQQLPVTGRLHGMYRSFQIPIDFMVCTAATARYLQTSWYVCQQLQDTCTLQPSSKIGKFEQQQLPGTGSFRVHVKQLLQDTNIWRVH